MLKNKKNVTLFFLLIIVITFYLPYFNVISWGGDYGTYLDQGKTMFTEEFNDFIENQKELLQYQNNRYPIYTPFGFPLLIKLFSYFHDYDLIKVKILIPTLLFFTIYFLYMNLKSKYKFPLVLSIVVNPNIQDQFREIQTEIPTTLLLIIGMFSKNKLLKNSFFLFSVLSRPSFLLFVLVYYLYELKNAQSYKNLLAFFTYLIGIHIFLLNNFNLKFYGFYETQFNTSGTLDILTNNLNLISIDSFSFIIFELGRLLTGFSSQFNYFLGSLLIIYLILTKNKYSIMSLVFIVVHNFWIAGYYVRYFLPILFLLVLSFDKYISTKDKHSDKFIYTLFFGYLLINTILSVINISNLELQRGPLERNSSEMLVFIDENYINRDQLLFTFHSPRVFNFLTGKKSYVNDKSLKEGTIVICEYKNEICIYPDNYKTVFKNKNYIILEP